MKVSEITNYLETIAPRAYQESYDNSGLLTGSPSQEITGVMITLDCIEEVVDEAIATKSNLIIAHHPILFKGLKKLTGSNYVERTIIKAIQNNIAIYALHTNLDNVHVGVNKKIAEKLGLKNVQILAPKANTLTKLVTFIPTEATEKVMKALHNAGAGEIGNYKNCSFQSEGTGTFMPNEIAKPTSGQANKQEVVKEIRAEVIFPSYQEAQVVSALKTTHPYEEVAYFLTSLSNENQEVGAGMVGDLEKPITPLEFLKQVKKSMGLTVIRHTQLLDSQVMKVAICGGSGSFLLPQAIRSGAQAFVTSDFKYHDFFDADKQILVADIGHYESEIFTKELIGDILREKFPTFALNFSGTITNPVRYLID
ncbi:MAG: Nif3-like dinuclear metal center hexameric protein [Cyclobacteriaceae bacterium]|nr:Nif3-like dinuclear metal center hexameric protein [Cyclobacteriaceae bacterium]